MRKLREYLVYYNNLDVFPFLEAIEKQHAIYRKRGMDMFKDGVSVPGLATKESDGNSFSVPLITKQNADLRSKMRNNLVSSPSLLFHRQHLLNKINTVQKHLHVTEFIRVCCKLGL